MVVTLLSEHPLLRVVRECEVPISRDLLRNFAPGVCRNDFIGAYECESRRMSTKDKAVWGLIKTVMDLGVFAYIGGCMKVSQPFCCSST